MRFLIDTNILIPLEPVRESEIEPTSADARRFLRSVQENRFVVQVHPATRHDINRDRDESRSRLRQAALEKYPHLPDPPGLPVPVESEFGSPDVGTNAWVDNQLLAAVLGEAVDFLVTEDRGIHAKARRCGVADRVLTVVDALSVVQDLLPSQPSPPPTVRAVKAHTLSANDPIFESFREDYPTFDAWLCTGPAGT